MCIETTVSTVATYLAYLTDTIPDPDWDAFVAAHAGGLHVQTSVYQQAERTRHHHSVRCVVRGTGGIVAGALVTLRPIPLLGHIVYISRGPLVAGDDPSIYAALQGCLRQLVHRYHVGYIVVQPPRASQGVIDCLTDWGFCEGAIGANLTASVVVDLRYDEITLMRRMRRTIRQSVRQGLRRGLQVREGGDDDLALFYQLHLETSNRQQFIPMSEAYFRQRWALFRQHNMIRMFIVEYADEPVSAALGVCFGHTVYGTELGWSGAWGKLHPNEVLLWSAFRWAQQHGYTHYDLGWIDPAVAAYLQTHGHLADDHIGTPTYFKLGFGGDIVTYPGSYDYVVQAPLAWLYRGVLPRLANSSSVRNLLDRVTLGVGWLSA